MSFTSFTHPNPNLIYKIKLTLTFCVNKFGLPKATSTCGLEEPGIKPPIFQLVDNPLYLLSHSRSKVVHIQYANTGLHIKYKHSTHTVYKCCTIYTHSNTHSIQILAANKQTAVGA